MPIVEASVAELTACYKQIMRGYSAYIVRDEAAFARKLAENASDGGMIISVGATIGRPLGYALYHPTKDNGCCVTELIADTAGTVAILQHLSARYPGTVTAKLLPDTDLPGQRLPQNALTIVNIPMALQAILGDDRALNSLPVGRLSQILCGYAGVTAGDSLLPALPCYCADEY